MNFPSPWKLLREAIKAVPAVRYALAVAGLGATVAIIGSFNLDWRVSTFGVLVVLVFMVAMLVFARLTKLGSPTIRKPAIFMLWAFLILTVSAAYLFAFSVVFDWPIPLRITHPE